MSSATELIHLLAAPLLLFRSTSLPAHLMPRATCRLPLNFQFQKRSRWIKHCREAHLAPSDVKLSVRGCALVRVQRRGGVGGVGERLYSRFSVSPYRGLLSRHWSLSCKLIGGVHSIKKNKCREPKHKGSNCTTWSRLLCIVWKDYLASGVYMCWD